jgi:transcription antitermination factor NusG
MTGQSNIWFIIQTNPQCETKAVEEIRRAGFRAYLPKAARDVRHHRTKELILKRRPALVGYVFMRFPDGRPNWYALRQCQGVKGVLYCDGRPYELAHGSVASLMRAQRAASYDTANARAYRMSRRRGEKQSISRAVAKAKFKPGMSVRASTGPWEHIIARIERVTKAGRIEAVTSLFGRETSVEYTELDKLDIVDEAA